VALSPAGPEQVHLARPATWPELRRLAELGLPLPDPGPGPGVNWLTLDWEHAAEAVRGARLVLADCRANAVPVAELSGVPGWREIGDGAQILAWNPELPPAPRAVAAFLRSVTAAVLAS
jgi:iron complex transport system substrate-binding protein